MNKSIIIKKIGINEYNEDCIKATELAKFTGDNSKIKLMFNSKVPHEISDLIWDSDLSMSEAINLWFDIYVDMPCYALLMYLKHAFDHFSINEKKYIIEKFYQILSQGNETNSKPIEYSLWCDFFEDDRTVTDVWNGLFDFGFENKNVVTSILSVSGPVPYYLKDKLYNAILDKEEYHDLIYKSLFNSYNDYYGNIDMAKAKKLIKKIKIDITNKEIRDFIKILKKNKKPIQ